MIILTLLMFIIYCLLFYSWSCSSACYSSAPLLCVCVYVCFSIFLVFLLFVVLLLSYELLLSSHIVLRLLEKDALTRYA